MSTASTSPFLPTNNESTLQEAVSNPRPSLRTEGDLVTWCSCVLSSLYPPPASSFLLCQLKLLHLAHVCLHFLPQPVRQPPSQLDCIDLAFLIICMPHLHRLYNAACLLRFQRASRLGLQFQLKTLIICQIIAQTSKSHKRSKSSLTLVTAVWKCRSEIVCGVVFVNANANWMAAGATGDRVA